MHLSIVERRERERERERETERQREREICTRYTINFRNR